jgi:hypothetical protein
MRASPSGELARRGGTASIVAMTSVTSIVQITVPLGGQQLELQEIVHAPGAMPMLRVRIREGKRFTVLDIDANSARAWGEAMLAWARRQAG